MNWRPALIVLAVLTVSVLLAGLVVSWCDAPSRRARLEEEANRRRARRDASNCRRLQLRELTRAEYRAELDASYRQYLVDVHGEAQVEEWERSQHGG